MAEKFADILDSAPSDNDRPKPLPQGSYVCLVKGLPKYDKSAKKGTPYVEFTLKPLSAGEDVDAEDLAAMGGFENKTIRATYYITEESVFRLNDFLAHCGLESDGEATRRQLIDQTPGCQVIAFIKHEASEDGQSVYAKLAKTAPVE